MFLKLAVPRLLSLAAFILIGACNSLSSTHIRILDPNVPPVLPVLQLPLEEVQNRAVIAHMGEHELDKLSCGQVHGTGCNLYQVLPDNLLYR